MDVPSPGASCNTLEKLRTCSICLLKSSTAAMLKMCLRKGHEKFEKVDAHFKHFPMKMRFRYSPSVLVTHQKAVWNSGYYNNLFLNCAIQLWGPNCCQSVLCYWNHKMMSVHGNQYLNLSTNYTHLASVWFFLNTRIISGNLASHLGFEEGVDIGIRRNMNVW